MNTRSVEALKLKAKLVTAMEAMSIVDRMLAEGGVRPDASARHNLAIARSNIMDACEALTDEEQR